MWRIVKQFNIPLHESLKISADDYPHTISFLIKKRMQVDSFDELSEDKKPPKSIWYKPQALTEWFDRVYDNKQTTFDFEIDEEKVEGE